jgi:hypothetical protein
MTKVKDKVSALTSGNWKKLMLELVVVFLGVSAGFLLNSWRIQRQEVRLERQYLSSFFEDINRDIRHLEEAIEADSIWLARAVPIVQSMQSLDIPIDSAKVMMEAITQLSRVSPRTGTYKDITNSGNLNIIRDYDLKKQIVDYHVDVEDINYLNDFIYGYFNDFVMQFLLSEYNLLRKEFRDPKIINSALFSNVVTGYLSMVQQRKETYEDLLEKSYELKKSLSNRVPEPEEILDELPSEN